MLIHLIKFVHLLFGLSLIATTVICLIHTFSPKFDSSAWMIRANKLMLVLGLFAMISGTFLVYPKHYTFHTEWIQAAYILLLAVGLIISALIYFNKKRQRTWSIAYLVILITLSCIIHDAVRKTAFIQF